MVKHEVIFSFNFFYPPPKKTKKRGITMILPWYYHGTITGFYHGVTMVLPGFTMVLPWDYRVLPWYDCGDAMVLKCYDITYKLYAMELPW